MSIWISIWICCGLIYAILFFHKVKELMENDEELQHAIDVVGENMIKFICISAYILLFVSFWPALIVRRIIKGKPIW